MDIKPSTAEKIGRVKKASLKTAFIAMITSNALIILPGAVFSVILGDDTPTIVVIGLSLLVWAAGYGVVRSVRANRRRRKEGAPCWHG